MCTCNSALGRRRTNGPSPCPSWSRHGGPRARGGRPIGPKWTDRSAYPCKVSGVKSPDMSPAEARSGPATQTLSRPMRSDALKNRERLLVAAGQVFEEKGLEASVADVARVAGVGMGTLYRRFPSKDALIEALVSEVLEATIAMAEEAATLPRRHGARALPAGGRAPTTPSISAACPSCGTPTTHLVQDGAAADRRPPRTSSPTPRRTAGSAPTSTSTDLSLVMWSIRGVLETTGSNAPEAWKRHLDLLVAGMRPTETALAHRPLSQNQVDRILSKREPVALRVGGPVTTLQEVECGRGSGQGDEPGPLVDPRRHRQRPAHGGARHDDHDHRPALGAARPRVLQHRSAVGRHRLHAGLRRLPAPGWPHQRHVRPEAHADDRRPRLRPGVGRRRGRHRPR